MAREAPSHRIKWDDAALQRANINSADREFMINFGLPILKHDELEFSTHLLLPVVEGTDCHRIGTYGILNDVPLFVRQSVSGVWTISKEGNQPILVNSTTRTFSHFIGLRENYLLNINKWLPCRVQQDFVRVIIKAMEDIDPPAMASRCLWSAFMEDIFNQAAYHGDDF
jgi:hypothetical protein